VRGLPAKQQGGDAGLWVFREGHDREQVHGGVDDVSESGKVDRKSEIITSYMGGVI